MKVVIYLTIDVCLVWLLFGVGFPKVIEHLQPLPRLDYCIFGECN